MSLLAREFSMKDLGNLSYFLGVHVTRNSQGIFLNQTKYAKEIIERADLVNCNQVKTPVDTNVKYSSSTGKPYLKPTLYRSLAGALQYLTSTRPDISYVVQQGQIRVLHVPTRFQIADIFTKGLPRILFEDFGDSLSIRPPPA
ncbi:uncharacterized mitochondrial protein AtMg00810-like [Rutidosis leptorrhynchoides]|uniref:uncharacterized mitochondrial protein AtMg00810-like n=1 Tax=Rutidosis leptorrhynchoides TaxID=125765 RepID=UPI003A9A3AFA